MWGCQAQQLGVFTPNPTMLTYRLFYACGVEKGIFKREEKAKR